MESKTAEATYKFSGKQAALGIFVLIVLLGIKLLSVGESKDPQLREAVLSELRNELGGAMQAEMNEIEDGDFESYSELSERSNPDGIVIHSISVSKPLLKFGSDIDAVLKVEFTLPGYERELSYYKANHGLVGSWRIRHETSSYSYYSNFF